MENNLLASSPGERERDRERERGREGRPVQGKLMNSTLLDKKLHQSHSTVVKCAGISESNYKVFVLIPELITPMYYYSLIFL